MAILVSKTRAQGASVVTTLPAEVARRLAVTAGQELEWIEDGDEAVIVACGQRLKLVIMTACATDG